MFDLQDLGSQPGRSTMRNNMRDAMQIFLGGIEVACTACSGFVSGNVLRASAAMVTCGARQMV